ncbi:protein kinase domain-containing protein [Wenjunlia tyrosinilytica]|uniref:Protein kinase domain-containing protein n=1 Tax=Wenjunlia tyrosinilytica TaxID=1544741 RepID=A0A917ZXZ2_9ACTN|nr:protein kinase [Wenjunlia tyrosinilytica]GGP00222.1 hypothetical protein GCM10012280_68510 [Wenjunlia tyrosinilytica]
MKHNEVVNGYRIVNSPTNAGGGKCMWAFAEKSGKPYFIKQFLSPKRPKPDAGGSERSKQVRLEACREFEQRHRGIMKLLKPDMPGGGHLVLATDFFAHGSTYYKVTARIDTSTLEKPQLLESRQKCILLKTLAVSLQLLHEIDVVHGDLKPANVLVQKRTGNAFHIAKLIDFDDSYLTGKPPDREEIAGDSLYGAPEWRRYVQDDGSVKAEQLTTAVDIFALGLMTHYYLTGALPQHSERFDSPADAVSAKEKLELDPRLTDRMRNLVLAMTSRAPASRPRIATVISTLKDSKVCDLVQRPPATSAASATEASSNPLKEDRDFPSPGRLRTNIKGTPRPRREPSSPRPETPSAATGAEPTAPGGSSKASDASRKSRVRINLGDRRK